MSYSLRKTLVALCLVAAPLTPILGNAAAHAEPVATQVIDDTNVIESAVVALQSEVEKQATEAAASKAAAEEKAKQEAAAKALAEARAAAEARASRDKNLRQNLALDEKQLALLTEEDRQALSAKPCAEPSTEKFKNGRLPEATLCSIKVGSHSLRPQAAVAFQALSKAFERDFKKPICVTDSYRTFDEQVTLKAIKPSLAATPGKSNHGWGLALDLCGNIEEFSTKEHVWMQLHAPSFGWHDPEWARKDGRKPEPWHWEYVAVEHEELPA